MSVAEPVPAARQPGLGLAGLYLVVPVAVVLAIGYGGPQESVLVLAPIVTFGLPLVVMVAFWWNGWPGSRLRPGWSGLLDTLLIAAGAVALTMLGQAVVEDLDVRAIFDPTPGPDATFPATMSLAGTAFVAILQITLVSEKWPLRGLGAYGGGVAAVAAAWAVALALDGVQFDGALLVLVGAWQVCVFVAWGGRPLDGLRRAWQRIAAGNALVIGGACATYVFVHEVLGIDSADVTAAGAALIAAGLIVGMLFEHERGVLAVPLLAAALYLALEAAARTVEWTTVTPDEWVAHAAMNAIAVSVILHVAIGHRWPFR